MNDNLYGVHGIRWSTSVDLSKEIVVCPLLSFYFFFSFFSIFFIFFWPQWLFLFISLFSSLGSFDLSSLGSFPHFRGNTLCITRCIEDLSHFTKVLNIKKMKLS